MALSMAQSGEIKTVKRFIGKIAKENVVVTFAQLYEEDVTIESPRPTMTDDIKTKAAAYAYMVFNLLCMPCFSAVGALKRELKTWKATGFAVGVQMLTAYVVALLVNVIGGLL